VIVMNFLTGAQAPGAFGSVLKTIINNHDHYIHSVYRFPKAANGQINHRTETTYTCTSGMQVAVVVVANSPYLIGMVRCTKNI